MLSVTDMHRSAALPMERRRSRRFPYPALVRVNGQVGTGIDISTGGLCVHLPAPVPVGDLVTVTLGGGFGRPDEISTRARVVRCPRVGSGFVVGLEFVA